MIRTSKPRIALWVACVLIVSSGSVSAAAPNLDARADVYALGSMLSTRGASAGFELEKLLLVLFVLLTAPVSAQLLARGAIARGVATAPGTQGRPLSGPIERVEEAEPRPADGG